MRFVGDEARGVTSFEYTVRVHVASEQERGQKSNVFSFFKTKETRQQ